jgi:excisionase family DNA binding protein
MFLAFRHLVERGGILTPPVPTGQWPVNVMTSAVWRHTRPRAERLQAACRWSDNIQRTRDCGPFFLECERAMITDRKTISIMKACELVGVSRRTIYNWIAGGKVEYIRTAGGSVRIFVDTLWREPGRASELTGKEVS